MEVLYLYDGSFEGFLCCIFESYAHREIPWSILSQEDEIPTLYDTRVIQTDPDHAGRVYRKIVKCSPYAAELLRKGFLTCMEDRELFLYHLVEKLLREGPGFLSRQSDETLYPVLRAIRNLTGEAHLLKGFVRFSDFGGVLGGEIAPKNRVLPLLRNHFCSRYREESFFLYDKTHKEALFYAKGKSAIRHLEHFEMAPPDQMEAHYRLLWKRFYDTIAIKERENPRCRMTNMPKRYWNTMTEFQDAAYFKAKNSPADAAIHDAPTGKPALGKP